ncbi:hypothetical protein B0H16DRAFT_1513618 [Mycena metata]|uniref:F-box domain-containing protein n=1 Tax=Mycena metata TaxID=1033252 RepID=A0AAD7JVU2_9AGAR|nr:hypothetical protein B0H16DRAFT_1513618 [Mycena metata]
MSIHLLDLPPEILVLIFSHLNLPTLAACLGTNRRVKYIIDGSALLQYRRAAQAACVEDNPWNTSLTSTEKLMALQKRQTAFTELRPSSIRTIPMDEFPIRNTYALCGGIFLMTEADEMSLRWFSLAMIEPVWQRLELKEAILEFALAVPEDDLLVVMSSSTGSDAAVKLRLYEFSTQSPHPMAREAVIFLPKLLRPDPHFELDICGSRLSLLTHLVNDEGSSIARLLVYDWKRNRLLMDISGKYSTAIFLSHDTILLTPHDPALFELWTIPDSAQSLAGPALTLRLPEVKSGFWVISRVESNPKAHGSASSCQPFDTSFTDSILTFHIVLFDEGSDKTMLLIVSRRGLCQHLPQSADEEHGKTLLWGEWGPKIARWLDADSFGLDGWPPVTHGQRCAFVLDTGSLVLYDFNPYTHRRILQDWGNKPFHQVGSTIVDVSKEGDSSMEFMEVCKEKVISQLGYVVSETAVEFGGVMIDDEWIVGINDMIDADGKFSLDVWHLG